MALYEFESKKKVLLSELLAEKGVIIDKPCGGFGKCGKCKVKVKGNISPISEDEKKLLTADEILSSIRLSCKTYVKGKCSVEIDNNIVVVGNQNNEFILKACAVAVDIGTTILEACFFSLPDYKLIKKAKLKNFQCQYGSDVLSRVNFSTDNERIKLLKVAVKQTLKEIAGELYDKIECGVITGNTFMLHMYDGIDTSTMAKYPFTPKKLYDEWNDKVYYPPCISTFVGADITTAILSSGMIDNQYPSILIDIGTNSEIVLFDGNKLYTTSTSAGPAFEGAELSCGMSAENGAIKKVTSSGEIEIIGDIRPSGICASGIVDAVSYMRSLGVLDNTGFLDEKFEIEESGVFITPDDIRKIQLAKAAIRAGIETLVSTYGLSTSKLKKIYLSGALGNNVDIENCIKIGMLPNVSLNSFEFIGNASLNGACMILKNNKLTNKVKKIAEMAEYIDLSLTVDFSNKFIQYVNF